MYMVQVYFYICCSECVGICGNLCRVAAVGVLSPGVLKYVCERDVVFYVCIVMHGTVGARVVEVWMFRHADVVCASCLLVPVAVSAFIICSSLCACIEML